MPVARDRASGLAESGVLPDAHDWLLVGVPNAAIEVGAAGDAAPAPGVGRVLDGPGNGRTAEVVAGDAGAATPTIPNPRADEAGRGGLAQAGAGRNAAR